MISLGVRHIFPKQTGLLVILDRANSCRYMTPSKMIFLDYSYMPHRLIYPSKKNILL